MNIETYRAKLAAHDWRFEFSDDHRVWQRGMEQRRELADMMRVLDPYAKVWNQYAPAACQIDCRIKVS